MERMDAISARWRRDSGCVGGAVPGTGRRGSKRGAVAMPLAVVGGHGGVAKDLSTG